MYILRASDACVVASADCKLAANCLVIRAARGTLLLHIEKQVLTPSKGQMQLVCTGYMLFSHASVLDICCSHTHVNVLRNMFTYASGKSDS